MSTSSDDHPTKRSYHHGDLASALVQAGLALLEADGPAGVSVRNAARRAGVSHNAPYRHFPSRDALLAELAAVGFDRLAQDFERATTGKPAVVALAALGHAYVAFANANPALCQLMFAPEMRNNPHPALRAHGVRAFELLRGVIAALAPEPMVASAAVGAWALAHGLAQLLADGHIPEAAEAGQLPERIRAVFDIYHRGVLALGEPPPAEDRRP